MSEKIEELTFDYRNEDGVLVRREVDRAVLSKGAWATIMFLYQDLDRAAGRYRAPKVAIVRYRKTSGVYRKQSSFNISSERQGRMIMDVLERWYAMTEEDMPPVEVGSTSPVETAGQSATDAVVETASESEPTVQAAEAGDSPVQDGDGSSTDTGVSPTGHASSIVEETARPMGETPSPFGGTNS